MAHIPPKRHLRKVQKRLARVDELALHEVLRPKSGLGMPTKQLRREYMDNLDRLLRDFDRILHDLLEDDDEERDQH